MKNSSVKPPIVKIIIVCLLGIIIGIVYGRTIIPILTAYPLNQDIAQDYIGARALIYHDEELYPILTIAFEKLGIEWHADHRSSHPPTAFLFVLPLTLFDYPTAEIIWVIAMFIGLVLSARMFKLAWKNSLIAGVLSLAWPPTIWSLGQLTPIWLLGLAIAFELRNHAFISGINIAIASLPKFFAAPALLHFLYRRKWFAFAGFVMIWLGAILLLFLLRPDAISTYFSLNVENSISQINRPDNGALLVIAWRNLGWIGLLGAGILILLVFWTGLKNDGVLGWACLVWLGVALLPIAWVYSLLPLLPWLVWTFVSPKAKPKLFAGIALLLPYLAPVPTYRVILIGLTILASGISFVLASEKPLLSVTRKNLSTM